MFHELRYSQSYINIYTQRNVVDTELGQLKQYIHTSVILELL